MKILQATRATLLTAALFAALVGCVQAEISLPVPQGLVTDPAGVLGSDVRRWLTANCEALRTQKQVELAILIVPDLQGTTDTDFAQRVYDSWKIGDKQTRKGLLFLVATKDRKVRLHVGYGLEGELPDGKVGALIDKQVTPAFRAGDIGRGVAAGTLAVMHELGASPIGAGQIRSNPRRRSTGIPPVAVVIMVVLMLGLGTVSPFWRYMMLDMLFRSSLGGPGSSGGFGGGAGFGGFGGGSSGGGGASRDW